MLSATSDGKTALRSGTTYAFTVRCLSADGSTYTSTWDSAGKTIVYLSVPELKSVELADASLCLSWGAVAGAQSYQVLRKNAQGQWQTIAVTNALTYTDKNPIAGITNCYSVRAKADDGRLSGYHAGITADYVSKPAVSALECEGSGVRVKWGAVTGAKKYRVYCKSGSGGWTTVGDTTSASLLVKTSNGKTALRSGTTYAFTVRCVSADGKSFTSDYNSTGKAVVFVSAPTISKLTNTKKQTLTAQWKKVSGAGGYQVQLALNKGFTSGKKTLKVSGGGKVKAAVSKLEKKKKYYVRVRAWKKSGSKVYCSGWSGAKAITLKKVTKIEITGE
jgi:allophanate hydrolase subunit 1